MNEGHRDMKEVETDEVEIKVTDKRRWAGGDVEDDADSVTSTEESSDDSTSSDEPEVERLPTMLEEFKARAETAERKLHDYIAAFKQAKEDHEQSRERLQRDIDRRVQLQFSGLVKALLESVDHLDLALQHASDDPATASLAQGVSMVRDRFIATLEQHGVSRVHPEGERFDPNIAEALRMDAVSDPALDGKVTEVLQPGYQLGDLIIRPARVAVGKA